MSQVEQIPIFPSSDFDRTAAFYGRIEFTEANRFGEDYLIVEHDAGIELHFFPASTKPRTNDHGAYVRFGSTDQLDEIYSRWLGLTNTPAFARVAGKIGKLHAPVDTDYAMREFALLDADGNLLRLGAPCNAL